MCKGKHDEDFELQSVSDDEEEDFWDKSDLDPSGSLMRRDSEGGPGVQRSLSLHPVPDKQDGQARDTIMDVCSLYIYYVLFSSSTSNLTWLSCSMPYIACRAGDRRPDQGPDRSSGRHKPGHQPSCRCHHRTSGDRGLQYSHAQEDRAAICA
ncbi:hypothetical protein EON63_07675 [archaeon]|nr:MAG: hypothetical protein EON63_07675 [archaeon]